VDTLGLVLKAVVHPADIQDRAGALLVLGALGDGFPRLRHIWADAGYRGAIRAWALETLGIEIEIVQHAWSGVGWVWVPPGGQPPVRPAGFQVVPRRWVVERTFGWIGRWRRLSKDYEGLPTTSEALVYGTMARLMLRRLARA
jgi:transposase